jgi:predicted Zn-dependent protease
VNRPLLASAVFASVLFAGSPGADAGLFDSNGYPSDGRAIDQLKPAADYSDVLAGRPLALGIMRTRGQGFVPSPALHDYVRGIMLKLLEGVSMPASFHPEVEVLAAPTFAGECTPDGTLMLTMGLLEQLETEDELAFVIGHELAHAIYRHHPEDWAKKAQFYAVVDSTSFEVATRSASLSLGGSAGGNIARGLDVAQHLAKLSSDVLMPQMERDQEDAADALGFDLMVKAGYDPEAAFAVMDRLAEQEAEAKKAADAARAAADQGGDAGDGVLGGLGAVGGLASTLAMGGSPSSDQIADAAIFAFDKAVDSMADDATAHHPATEREALLSAYIFRAYRDIGPRSPMPLPWAPGAHTPLTQPLTALLAHYTDAEDAAAYVAAPQGSMAASALADVRKATSAPTIDHAYTEYAAFEYYSHENQAPKSEAALRRAVAGPEPSWEIYSRLVDIDMSRQDYAGAQTLMDQAVTRFQDSPVLLPKRIAILRADGRASDAEALDAKCKSYDIGPLSDACKKALEG